MSELQRKLSEFMNNVELLKNIRTLAILLFAIVGPFIYFGFVDQFTISALLRVEVTGIIVLVSFTIIIITKEIKLRAFDDEIEHELNTELKPLLEEVKNNGKDIINNDKRLDKSRYWINEYNQSQQELYNKLKTDNYIHKLERKIVSYNLVGKSNKADKIIKEIERLNKDGLTDTSFKPYKLERLIRLDKIKHRAKKGDTELSFKPTKINWINTIINTILKSSGVGGMFAVPFLMKEDPMTIFWFYVMYIITITITIITQYLTTRYKTRTRYYQSQSRIKDLQSLLLEFLKGDDLVSNLNEEESTIKESI